MSKRLTPEEVAKLTPQQQDLYYKHLEAQTIDAEEGRRKTRRPMGPSSQRYFGGEVPGADPDHD